MEVGGGWGGRTEIIFIPPTAYTWLSGHHENEGVGGGGMKMGKREIILTDLSPTLSPLEWRGGPRGYEGGGEEGDYILTYRLHCHHQNQNYFCGCRELNFITFFMMKSQLFYNYTMVKVRLFCWWCCVCCIVLLTLCCCFLFSVFYEPAPWPATTKLPLVGWLKFLPEIKGLGGGAGVWRCK